MSLWMRTVHVVVVVACLAVRHPQELRACVIRPICDLFDLVWRVGVLFLVAWVLPRDLGPLAKRPILGDRVKDDQALPLATVTLYKAVALKPAVCGRVVLVYVALPNKRISSG